MKRLLLGLTVMLVFAVAVAASGCSGGGPDKVSYIVVPHPDDEMQAWSLIENTPDIYEVYIVMTRGEQSFYCGLAGMGRRHRGGTARSLARREVVAVVRVGPGEFVLRLHGGDGGRRQQPAGGICV